MKTSLSIISFILFAAFAFKPLDSKPAPKSLLFELARKGMLDSAYAMSLDLSKSEKTDDTIQYLLGKLELDGKQSDKHFRKLISDFVSSPFLAEAYYRLAQSYFARGNYGMAIHFYRLCIQNHPGSDWSEPSHYWMAISCLRYASQDQGYLDTASLYLKRLISQNDTTDVYFSLAWEAKAQIAQMTGNKNKASEALHKAKRIADPEQLPHIRFLELEFEENVKNTGKLLTAFIKDYPNSLESEYLRRKFPKRFENLPARNSYTIQLGAFESKSTALQYAEKIKQKGLKASVNQREKSPPFTVTSGKFSQKSEAQEKCAQDFSRIQIPCFVLKLNN